MLTEDAQSLLKRVGLNQYESKIYAALLSSKVSTAGHISEKANVPRSRVYDVLRSLEKKGFAVMHVGRPVKYTAVTPDGAIDQMKAQLRKEHERTLESYDKLSTGLGKELEYLYKKAENDEKSYETISLIRGNDKVYTHMKRLINGSKKSIVKVTNERGVEKFGKHCRAALEGAKRRGVKTRILARTKTGTPMLDKLEKVASVKRHSTLDGRFFIRDGKEVLMITSPTEDKGIWVKNPYIASSLEKLFEHAWEKGESISG